MKQINILKSITALIIATTVPTILIADDTEIFFNEEVLADTEEFQPNVLFVFDTSGSMGWNITTQEDYEPSTDYGAPGTSDTIYIYNSSLNYQNRTIDPSRNSCQAMLDHLAINADTPLYVGKAREWRKHGGYWRWRSITNSTKTVECQDDANVHGIDADATDLYAANGGNGPYTNNANQAISWGDNSKTRWFTSENYHSYMQTVASVSRVKIDVMKEAAVDLVNEFNGLNFGLMRFDGSSGGYVKHHFSDIETDRTNITNSINALTANGNTPLSETLWEAHKYFLGGSVEYGTNSNRDSAAVTNGSYNSPITDSTSSCQKNYIVYLTDGNPYSDSGRDNTIRTLTNTNSSTCDHSDGASSPNDTCLDELAGYMANHDYSSDLSDTQDVRTYTIGFDIDMDLLKQTAINGKGTYHTVSSSQELKTAFNEILLGILSTSTNFTAPAVSVNAFNSLQHRDEVYYAIFEPSTAPRWYGNIKKYRINSDGEILDSDNQIAVDGNTGYFTPSAKSFWAGITDGFNVRAGGAASQLTNSRTIFTVAGDPTQSDISLNTAENKIELDNDLIVNTHYGLDDDDPNIAADRPELISWILGADLEDENENSNLTEASLYMADPLHSRPVVVTYEGANNIITDDTLFATTNDGAFHIIDTTNGQEIFAFIPQSLLPNQLDYKVNDPDGIRRYGLDGPMTIWRKESTDKDITIEANDGDHVYAYFGMRRGGNNYYALDVTDKTNPKVMWSIFGSGNPPAIITDGFTDLGQTWSKPIRAKINWGCDLTDPHNPVCTKKDVLFFAGGYDPVHDNATSPTSGDTGAVIYMVDAVTGTLLWSAGNNNNSSDTHDLNLPMENSIPGDVTVADMDADGAADILFAVDILGHVWRVDFNSQSTSAADFSKHKNSNNTFVDSGSEIANLTDTEFRRFYVGPFVSLSLKRGRESFFVITMGTGYTAHPKDTTVNDRIYAIFERSISSPPRNDDGDIEYRSFRENDPNDPNDDSYSLIANIDLLDVTDPLNGPADSENNAPHGFYKVGTAPGEKFLRSPLTRFGYSLYTSYLPEGNGNNVDTSCGADYLGGGRIYAMNFITGESAYSGEHIDLKHAGIAPEPVSLLIPDENERTQDVLCVGTECFSPDEENPNNANPWGEVTTQVMYWRENLQ